MSNRIKAEIIFPGTNADNHNLGTGLAVGQWASLGSNGSNDNTTMINYIKDKIKELETLFPRRIKFGLIGQGSHYGPPSKDLIHVWGANAGNWDLPNGKVISGGGQAATIGPQIPGVFGIVTTPVVGINGILNKSQNMTYYFAAPVIPVAPVIPNTFNVLQYNVSWEAFDSNNPAITGNGADMSHCKPQGQPNNKCVENISTIITTDIPKSNQIREYDFISLVECKTSMYQDLIKYNPTFWNNYFIEKHEGHKWGLVTVINNKYKGKYSVAEKGNLQPGRPYIIFEFKNPDIILVNLHMPHNDIPPKPQTNAHYFNPIIDKIREINSDGKPRKIIICGDFNNNNPYSYVGQIPGIKQVTYKIKTCCVHTKQTKGSYDKLYDYIFSNGTIQKYNTINYITYAPRINTYMSDHLPIFAQIKF
jgi:exonuclease III